MAVEQLTAIRFEPCQNDRDCWCRVWTLRAGSNWRISDLSWPLARRIADRIVARYRVSEHGLFTGRCLLTRKAI